MEASKAIVLLNNAVMAFNDETDESKRYKLGRIVINLRETLPDRLPSAAAREAFLTFVDDLVVKTTPEAAHLLLRTDLDAVNVGRRDMCLKNNDYNNCGGPPVRAIACHLCKRKGGKI